MPYNGPNNLVLYTMINKKYSLPKSVLNMLYKWILEFRNIKSKLPVMWFKTVLVFVENYHTYFTEQQKEDMKHLVKKIHKHHIISREIVRKMANRGMSMNVTMVDDSRMIRG